MSAAFLLLAATLTVAIPPFQVDHVSGMLSQRLPVLYAAGFQNEKCAIAKPPSQLGPQTLTGFAECADRTACLGNIGRVLAVDMVLHGKVSKSGGLYHVDLLLFDVRKSKVVEQLHQRIPESLTALEMAVRRQIPAICKGMNPAWQDPNSPEMGLAHLSFEAPPTQTAPVAGFDDLPPMADDPMFAALPPPPTPAKGAKAATPPPPPDDIFALPPGPGTAAPVKSKVAAAKPSPKKPAPSDSEGMASLFDLPPTPPPPVRTGGATPRVASATPKTPAATTPKMAPAVATLTPPPTHPVPLPRRVVTPVPSVRRFPWGTVLAGGALAFTVTGVALGAESHSIWSSDHTTTVDGVVQHSITHQNALKGNHFAGAADALFAIAAAAGVGAGVLIYAQGGLGIGGHF